MKTMGKLTVFALSLLLLGVCSSQTKQVQSRSSNGLTSSGLTDGSNKNRETSSSQEVVPDESHVVADERTEPNPPLLWWSRCILVKKGSTMSSVLGMN